MYTLVNIHNYGKSQSLIGKSTINGPFSIAMLNYQRVVGMYGRGFSRYWEQNVNISRYPGIYWDIYPSTMRVHQTKLGIDGDI